MTQTWNLNNHGGAIGIAVIIQRSRNISPFDQNLLIPLNFGRLRQLVIKSHYRVPNENFVLVELCF